MPFRYLASITDVKSSSRLMLFVFVVVVEVVVYVGILEETGLEDDQELNQEQI